MRRSVPLACVLLAASLAGANADEQAVKAAFVHRFTGFVSWPAAEPGAPFTICVAGAPGVADDLARMTEGKSAQGRPVRVETVAQVSRSAACDLLFLGAAASSQVDAALSGRRGLLTVSDVPGFAKRGGMIGLVKRGSSLGFEVHRGAAERAGLHLDARLLKLAAAVYP